MLAPRDADIVDRFRGHEGRIQFQEVRRQSAGGGGVDESSYEFLATDLAADWFLEGPPMPAVHRVGNFVYFSGTASRFGGGAQIIATIPALYWPSGYRRVRMYNAVTGTATNPKWYSGYVAPAGEVWLITAHVSGASGVDQVDSGEAVDLSGISYPITTWDS